MNMFVRTGEMRRGPSEKCICKCGKMSWVRVCKDGSLKNKGCNTCVRTFKKKEREGIIDRECRECKIKKKISYFCKSKSSTYLCLECKSDFAKSVYANDPLKSKTRIKIRYEQNRKFLDNLKSEPCEDCGETFSPCQMDYDHITNKKIDLSKTVNWSQENILKEIAKCRLICANCHRDRTQIHLVEKYYKNNSYGGSNKSELYTPTIIDEELVGVGFMCTECGLEKPKSSYNTRENGNLRRQCRLCRAKKDNILSRLNSEERTINRIRRSKSMSKWFESLKHDKSCKDCEKNFPYWKMDFDHIENKQIKPSSLKNSLHSKQFVLQELNKCDLVCANCHRLRTKRRQQNG